MYNGKYDEYIRSILGYPTADLYNDDNNAQNMNYGGIENQELEDCYPEIYKIVYPMVKTKCDNCRGNVSRDDIENMTDEIYFALEQNETINSNLNNSAKANFKTNQVEREMRTANRKPEVMSTQNTEEKRESRQINRNLRDLIKILLIRELLNRFGRRPNMIPRPPMPGHGPGQRPPYRPGPGRPPFNNRDFENPDYDIYQY